MDSQELPVSQEILVPRTAINDVIERDFADHLEAWSDQGRPLFGRPEHVHMGSDRIGVDFTDYQLQDSYSGGHRADLEIDDRTAS